MNKENILKVADAIERHTIPDLGFNMGSWVDRRAHEDKSGHNCGTTACIAGWATAVAGGNLAKLSISEVRDEAIAYLGVTRDQAFWLFAGFRGDPEPPEAVATLRNLAETGKVNWSVVK